MNLDWGLGLASDRISEEMKRRCIDIIGGVVNGHGNKKALLLRGRCK